MRQKDQAKLEAIYEATLDIVFESGISGLKMNQVAKKAGLASGTLYIYFNSKEQLLIQLFRELNRQSLEYILQAHQPGLSYKLNFKALWINFLTYSIHNIKRIVFTEQFKHSPFIGKVNEAELNAERAPLLQLLDRGKQELFIKNIDNKLLLASLHGITRELATLFASGKMAQKPEYLEAAFQLCWDSVKA